MAPALLIWVLLREGSEAAVTTAPGWNSDPGDPGRRRFWDGTAWTDQTTVAEEAPHHTT